MSNKTLKHALFNDRSFTDMRFLVKKYSLSQINNFLITLYMSVVAGLQALQHIYFLQFSLHILSRSVDSPWAFTNPSEWLTVLQAWGRTTLTTGAVVMLSMPSRALATDWRRCRAGWRREALHALYILRRLACPCPPRWVMFCVPSL